MKTPALLVTSVLLAAGMGTVLSFWNTRKATVAASTPSAASDMTPGPKPKVKNTVAPAPVVSAVPGKPSNDLEARIVNLEAAVAELRATVRAGGENPRRVVALEKSLTALQSAMDGVSLERASVERSELFAGEDGYVKADEYFEAGKFMIAGEGYLTFVQSNPGHPDTREVMKKARDAFLKAGYKDKAFWVQDEMMKAFPDHMAADVEELAVLEKNAGMYDRAVEHMAQAADLAGSVEERLWKRLYWAWYVQLRDGAAAGITALEQVQREIAASGVRNPKLEENASRRMREWQEQLSRR